MSHHPSSDSWLFQFFLPLNVFAVRIIIILEFVPTRDIGMREEDLHLHVVKHVSSMLCTVDNDKDDNL